VNRPGSRAIPLVNAANAVTVARLALVPVFLLLLVGSEMTRPGWRAAACVVFLAASVTDVFDGWIARRYGLVTSFGKIADPIVDKALTGTALVLLSAYGRLAWAVTVVILAREVGVTALRLWEIRRGVIPASRGGKAKTGLQIAAIAWYLWPVPEPADAVGPWLMGAAVAVTVLTGLDYAVRAVRLRRRT